MRRLGAVGDIRPPGADRRRRTKARLARARRTASSAAARARRRRARPPATRPPLPAPSRRTPRARRQGPPSQGKGARGGERRRSGGGGAGLGRLESLFQRSVVRNPENLGGGGQRGAPLAGRALAKLPAGEKELSRGSGIAARPAEVQRVAQRRLVFGAAGAAHAWPRRRSRPGGGAKHRTRAGFLGRWRRGG